MRREATASARALRHRRRRHGVRSGSLGWACSRWSRSRARVDRGPRRHHGRADLRRSSRARWSGLLEVVGICAPSGVAVVYVSHRLDEVFRLCDRVTVLRDGDGSHSGPIAERDRLELVSTMLGRDAGRGPATAGRNSATHDTAGGATRPASERPDAHGTCSRTCGRGARAARSSGWPACSARAAPRRPRPSTARDPLDCGEGRGRRRAAGPRSPAAAITAGIALLPEDRKAEGIIPTCRCARTSCCRPAASSRAGFVSDAPAATPRRAFMHRLRIKASSPDQRSASCPAATSRRCCSPAGCAASRRCCSSTSRPAASTSAPRPRSRP